MAPANILNPVDVSPNARYPTDFGNMRRRTGCRNFLKQLIDESHAKLRQFGRNIALPVVCDWYFPNLPNSIFDRFGSTIDREGNVPSLADWTGNELQILHRELDSGSVRVDIRNAEEMTGTGTRPRTVLGNRGNNRDFLPQSNRDLMNRMKLEINRKTGRPVPNNTAHVDVINPEPRPGFLVLNFRWAFTPEYPRFPQGYFVNWSDAECLECLYAFDARKLSVCRITEPSQSPVVDLVELPKFRVRLEPESPPPPSRSTSSYEPLNGPNGNSDAVAGDAIADDVVNPDRIETFEFEFLPSPVEPEDRREAAPLVSQKQPSDNNRELGARGEDCAATDEFTKLFAAIRAESERLRGNALKAQSEQLNRAANVRRALEQSVLKEKVGAAERKASKWNTERTTLKKELQESKWNITRLSGDYAVLRKNLTSAQNGIDALNKNLQDSGRVNGQLTNDNFVLEGKLEEMRKAFEFDKGQLGIDKLILEKEVEDMKKEVGELPDKVATLQLRLADTETRLEGAQVFRADAERRLEAANARLQEQSNEFSKLADELDMMRERLQTQVKDSSLLEKQHEMSENYIKELRQEMRRKIAAARKKGEAEGRDKAIEDMGRQHIRTLEDVPNERLERKAYSVQECCTQTSPSLSREFGNQTLPNSRDCVTQTPISSLQECATQTMANSSEDHSTQTSASSVTDCGIQATEVSDTAGIKAPVPVQELYDVAPSDTLPEPGVLSTKILAMLEILSTRVDSLEAYQLLREEIIRRYVEPAPTFGIIDQHVEGYLQSTEAQHSLGEFPGSVSLSGMDKNVHLWDDYVEKVEELKQEDLSLSPSMPPATPAPSSPTHSHPAPLLANSPPLLSSHTHEYPPQTIDPTSLELSKPVQSGRHKPKRRRPLPTKPVDRHPSPISSPETSYDDESTIIVDTSALSAPIRKKRRRLPRDG